MGIISKIKKAGEVALDRYIGQEGSSQKLIKSMPLGIEEFKRKSIYWSEDQLTSDVGYKERYTGITFETLHRMAVRDSITALVINKIINNVVNFARPSSSKFETGFKFVLRNPHDDASDEDKRMCFLLEEWLMTCGNPVGRPSDEDIDFETFLRVSCRDRLVYGQTAIELIRDRLGRIHHFLPVPAGTIRYTSAQLKRHPDMLVGPVYGPDGERITNDGAQWQFEPSTVNFAKYCQVYHQRMIQLFSEDELILTQATPINDIESRAYSLTELELLVNVVSAHISAETHNRLFFTNGMSQNGVLFIKGDIPTQEMESFRRAWHAITAGTRNSARLPIISGVENIEWVNMSVSNKDMEWTNFNEYLIKIICLPKDTSIITSSGYKNIQDLKLEDKVVSHTGEERNILNLQKKIFKGDMYTISGMGFKNIQATDEHPFYVAEIEGSSQFARDFVRRFDLKTTKFPPISYKWKKANELKLGDRLVCPKPKQFESGECFIDASKYLDGLEFDYNEDTIWIPGGRVEVPRWYDLSGFFGEIVGWYAAEGSANGNYCQFAMGTLDQERWQAPQKIQEFMSSLGIGTKITNVGKNCHLQVNSKIFATLLKNLVGQGSSNKHIPLNVNWTQEAAINFINGYAKGDGHCAGSSLIIGSVSKDLIYGVRWLLLKMGIFGSVAGRTVKPTLWNKNPKKQWHILFGGRNTKAKFPNYKITEARKNNYLEDDKYFYLSINKITKEYVEQEVYNFEVEHDNSYIADSVATHNCGIYMMNPTEINFDIVSDKGGGMGGKGMGNKIEQQNKLSKVESLKPILRYFERIINSKILPQAFPDNDGYIAKKYKLAFVGLDYDKDKELERLEKETKSFKTVNEARKEVGLPPINIPGADDFIRDPTYFSLWSQYSPSALKITRESMQQNQQITDPGAAPTVNTEVEGLLPLGEGNMKDSVVPLKKSKTAGPSLTINYFK